MYHLLTRIPSYSPSEFFHLTTKSGWDMRN